MSFLVGCLAFTVFDKTMGRDVLQRWRPKNQLDLAYWPSVDGWLRARLALESSETPFVIFHMNEEYETRAFVCSQDNGIHVLRACVWDAFDDDHRKSVIFANLCAWHEHTFPDAVVTVGDLPDEERHAWEKRV